MRVFVGLGNPGKKYEMTRHNIGFLVVQSFAHLHGISFREESRFSAFVGKGKVKDVEIHLILPTTFMNLSGQAVRSFCDYHKVPLEKLVVVVDDAELPFGELRLRGQGSSGGHNGLKSIQAHLGTAEYARLRMGIGRGDGSSQLADHVLDRFSVEEEKQLVGFLNQGVAVMEMLLDQELVNVMNKVNRN